MTLIIPGGPKGVRFIQKPLDDKLPPVARYIERPVDIQFLADTFAQAGGKYLIAADGDQLRLAAILPHRNGTDILEVASATAINGIVLPLVVDQLVRESVRKMDLVQ